MLSEYFFESWQAVARTLLLTVLVYFGTVIILRFTGKRTFTRMTAFDLVIPLTLGPIMAATILETGVSLIRGLSAFVLLVGLHVLMTIMMNRFRRVRRIFKPEPTLLVFRGEYLHSAMHKERVLPEEVREVVRSKGFAAMDEVEGVVLEADGTFSVISRSEAKGEPSLLEVVGYPPEGAGE